MRALVQVVLNAVALWLAAEFVPGITWQGGIPYLLLAGLVFGLINLLVKPILTFFSIPFIILSLGLFLLLVNAAMLKLADVLLSGLSVDGFWAAVFGGVVIAIFNWLVGALGAKD